VGSTGDGGGQGTVDELGHMVVGTGQDRPGALGEEPFLSFPFF
jgi:hypothetical protein